MNLNRMKFQSVRMLLALFFLFGCARVNLTSKEPIKLDVTMRLDIYQHVVKDADAIENMIASPKAEKTSWLMFGVQEAFAEEGAYPVDVQAAIDARIARRVDLLSWEAKGVIGENASGYVELRDQAAADVSAALLISEENKDRKVIYDYVARKNGTDVEGTEKVFAKRIQSDAPAGTPIENADSGWMKKI